MKQKNNFKISLVFLFFIFIINYYILFLSKNCVFLFDDFSNIIVIIITIFFSYLLCFGQHSGYIIKKYLMNWKIIIVLFVILINTFMVFGQTLFLQEIVIKISFQSLFSFFLGFVWMFAINFGLLYILEMLKPKKINNKKNVYLYLVILGIILLIWGIDFFANFPGTMTSDSIDQYLQAAGMRTITQSHPAFMTILIRVSLIFTKSSSLFLGFQIVVCGLIVSYILYNLYLKGIPQYMIIIISIFFSIFPSNLMMIVCLWKDVLYTFSLILMTYLFYVFSKDYNKFFSKYIFSILMIISFLFVYLFRHNGIGPLLFGALYLVFVGIKQKSIKNIILVFCIILSIFIIKYPVYSAFNVDKKDSITKNYSALSNLIVRTTGNVLQHDWNVNKSILDVTNNYASKELLSSNFSKYNIDKYAFSKDIIDYQSNLKNKKITNYSALITYLRLIKHYPNDVLKERLDGSDILWNINQPWDGFNSRYATGIWLPDGLTTDEREILNLMNPKIDADTMVIIPSNRIYNKIVGSIDYLNSINIFDSLFFRGGIFLLLLLLCFIYLIYNNKSLLPILIPFLGNTLTWVVLLSYQTYRYVYYIQGIGLLVLLIIIVENNNLRRVKNEKG